MMGSVFQYMSLLRRSKKVLPLPPIFVLNVDCFDKIFDHLSLTELHAFAGTCKRFRQITGDYYQRVYISTGIRGAFDGIYACSETSCSGELNDFSEFINQITIHGSRNLTNDLDIFRFIKRNCGQSLKQIQLVDVTLTKLSVKKLKNHLNTVEVLEIDSCVFYVEFYNDFLKHCKNLRKLCVRRSAGDFKWIRKSYPKLQHLELFQIGFKIDELAIFFERNCIRSLSIDARCLWHNEQLLMNSNVSLDDLIIDVNGSEFLIEPLCRLFNKLFVRGFYKRLHLYAPYKDYESIEQMTNIHGFRKLFITHCVNYGIVLPHLNSLTELGFRSCPIFLDIDNFSAIFENLERIYFEQATINDILPFIYQLVNLKKINVDLFKDENKDQTHFIIDLETMNNERAKLQNSFKVTIYVEEKIYLKIKQMTGITSFSHIDIKRNDSYIWNNHFEFSHRL